MFSRKPPSQPPTKSAAPPAAPAAPAPAPAAPAAPTLRGTGWHLQVLTTDFVAEGYLPPAETPLAGFLNATNQSTLTLSPAKLMPLALQAMIATDNPPEITVAKSTLIAVIPLDEVSQRSAGVQLPPRAEKAVLYAGPFMIRASVRLMGDMPLRHLFNTGVGNVIIATNAEIVSLRADSVFSVPAAPVVILNKSLVQLYHSAAE
jgi:hypothetical protein